MSETQFGRDLCATERHIFEDGPTCLRCGEPAPAIDEATKQAADKLRATMADLRQVTMPERVWLTPDVFNRLLGFYRSGRGGEYDAAADTLNAHDTALRTALLAAEARVREVEAAFKKYGDHWDQCPAVTPRRKCNCGYAQARAILAREAGE